MTTYGTKLESAIASPISVAVLIRVRWRVWSIANVGIYPIGIYGYRIARGRLGASSIAYYRGLWGYIHIPAERSCRQALYQASIHASLG